MCRGGIRGATNARARKPIPDRSPPHLGTQVDVWELGAVVPAEGEMEGKQGVFVAFVLIIYYIASTNACYAKTPTVSHVRQLHPVHGTAVHAPPCLP